MTTITRDFERGVLITDDGEELSFTKRPGTLADYDRELQEARRQFPEAFARLPSLDEYLKERREEAEREWKE